MSNSIRLKLPFILESQAQKEVTHNEALEIIDVLLHPYAISIGESEPPKDLRACLKSFQKIKSVVEAGSI